jgi:arylsulfatase A-like enzyme
MRAPVSLALALIGLSACGSGAEPGRHGRGVLVLAIDALRADHLEAQGYDRETMPRLVELAEEGALFADAWAAAPELVPSHASLLTGCDPGLARRPPLPDGTELAEAARWWVPEALPRLARELLLAGFSTAAFVDHPSLSPVYGFEAGFEHFTGYRVDTKSYELGFESVGEKFLRWMQGLGRQQDWFAYVHVNDLERLWRVAEGDPKWETWFEPREELGAVPPVAEADRVFFAVSRRRWERGGIYSLGVYEARYDGALRRTNGLVHRLLLGIREQGWWPHTTVVVVGTYGFGFGESGLLLDAGTLTDVDLHVPLIVRPATWVAGAEKGLRSERLASLVDVAPTVLELCGVPIPADMQGRSLAPLLRGTDEPVRERAFASGGVSPGFAVIEPRWRYERVAPGAHHPGVLVESWFGEGPPDRVEYREHLVERASGAPPGDLFPSWDGPGAAEEAARLRREGDEHLRAIDAQRAALHRTPWSRE